jgi:hypothetical protein
MMKRVYVGAIHDTEYGAAYNAAFGLARLHGLVVDRAQLDVIRRPSREPDAPAEQALSSWIAELPPYNHGPQGPGPLGEGPGLLIEATRAGCDFDTTREGPGAAGEIGNGAPTRPVTGSPHAGGRSTHTEPSPGGRSTHTEPSPIENGSSARTERVPAPTGEAAGSRADHDPAMQLPVASRDATIPRAEDLF